VIDGAVGEMLKALDPVPAAITVPGSIPITMTAARPTAPTKARGLRERPIRDPSEIDVI
jgi:hypothetical protein